MNEMPSWNGYPHTILILARTGVELGEARKQLAPNVVLRKLIAAWEEGA